MLLCASKRIHTNIGPSVKVKSDPLLQPLHNFLHMIFDIRVITKKINLISYGTFNVRSKQIAIKFKTYQVCTGHQCVMTARL